MTGWDGLSRPSADDLRSTRYDTDSGQLPIRKLVICSSPRTSSKRLARLLLAAGLGVPMEYFNERNVRTLTERWTTTPDGYLAMMYRRRTVHGVFAATVQHHQVRAWKRPADFTDLLAGAVVVYLSRSDRDAQAASLAACMLTGNWGFEPGPAHTFSRRQLRQAAARAVDFLDQEDRGWAQLFLAHAQKPLRLTDTQVIDDPARVIQTIADQLGVTADAASLNRMIAFDQGAYAVDRALKDELTVLVGAIRRE